MKVRIYDDDDPQNITSFMAEIIDKGVEVATSVYKELAVKDDGSLVAVYLYEGKHYVSGFNAGIYYPDLP